MISQTWQNSAIVCVIFWCGCESQRTWKFGTSNYYVDLKIFTNENELYSTIRISKESALMSATMECATACGAKTQCLAFNFYEDDESYVCEIVPDNLCTNRVNKVFVPQVGSNVWDKLNSTTKKACIETLVSSGQGVPCTIFRPGCLGTWPNCSSCTKTCIDCNARALPSCMMWPDGSGQNSVPIIGRCVNSNTVLMVRNVPLSTGKVVSDYRMALYDMHRIYRLHAYSYFQFSFENYNGKRMARYQNWAIDANGTLMNLLFSRPSYNPYDTHQDILALNGQALKPAKFVEVTNDSQGCGSFWLLDSSSPIYCPGGKNGLFGTPKLSGTTVVSTGIKCSLCSWGDQRPMEYAIVELTN